MVTVSGNDSVFAKICEELAKHVFGVDASMEARATGLDRAGDIVELHQAQDSVGKWPRRNLFVRDRPQVMPFDNGFPDGLLVSHINGERRRDRISHGHIEHGGDTRPEISPAKIIAVGYVEDLVSRGLGL